MFLIVRCSSLCRKPNEINRRPAMDVGLFPLDVPPDFPLLSPLLILAYYTVYEIERRPAIRRDDISSRPTRWITPDRRRLRIKLDLLTSPSRRLIKLRSADTLRYSDRLRDSASLDVCFRCF